LPVPQIGTDLLERHERNPTTENRIGPPIDLSIPGVEELSSVDLRVQNPVLRLVADDLTEAEALGGQLANFAYDTEVVRWAGQVISTSGADALLVAMNAPDREEAVLASLHNAQVNLPLLVVSPRDDFRTRLWAVRAGAVAFWKAPTDVLALVTALDRQLRQDTAQPYRALLVDDDPAVLRFHGRILAKAGMLVETVERAEEVLASIDRFNPDLVIADLYMPGVNGVELAMIIRQQSEYDGIPIVFLSAETDHGRQQQALGIGADDFLQKPIAPAQLVSVVSARAERSRAVRRAMMTDGLTGLLGHKYIKAELELELARARRSKAPLSVVLIDIDHFKQVNDRYGHPMGDRVLRVLARLLKQRLRATDRVGRYGGEEFMMVLPETTAEAAKLVVDDLRQRFSRIAHKSEHGELRVSFSGGIAQADADTPILEVVRAADAALYTSKVGGRDRISLARERPIT
jgi:diguanylate cyclase (GGDEF)-like protein